MYFYLVEHHPFPSRMRSTRVFTVCVRLDFLTAHFMQTGDGANLSKDARKGWQGHAGDHEGVLVRSAAGHVRPYVFGENMPHHPYEKSMHRP